MAEQISGVKPPELFVLRKLSLEVAVQLKEGLPEQCRWCVRAAGSRSCFERGSWRIEPSCSRGLNLRNSSPRVGRNSLNNG